VTVGGVLKQIVEPWESYQTSAVGLFVHAVIGPHLLLKMIVRIRRARRLRKCQEHWAVVIIECLGRERKLGC